jgi:hypothetical protein
MAGAHTTVVTAIPRVAASSSLRFSGVWIWRSPFTTMYWAKEPSVSRKEFLQSEIKGHNEPLYARFLRQGCRKYGQSADSGKRYSRAIDRPADTVTLFELFRDGGADFLHNTGIITTNPAVSTVEFFTHGGVLPIRGVDCHSCSLDENVVVGRQLGNRHFLNAGGARLRYDNSLLRHDQGFLILTTSSSALQL